MDLEDVLETLISLELEWDSITGRDKVNEDLCRIHHEGWTKRVVFIVRRKVIELEIVLRRFLKVLR